MGSGAIKWHVHCSVCGAFIEKSAQSDSEVECKKCRSTLEIFVKDDVSLDENDGDGNDNNGKNPDDAKNDTGKAPQTGDRLPLYLAIGCVALASAAISWRKIKK